ncbi:MAG: septum formation initiator family protein [Planctomycetes bacterium]|nr:septum formation initiator family protein [Planctomycetota bacterium]
MQNVNAGVKNSGNYPSVIPITYGEGVKGLIKDEFPRRNKYFGKFVLMVFVTSCVVILFSSIITKVRQERFRMLESKTALEKQAAQLEAENSILDREYSALKSDPVRIEQEARNQFGYIAPEEVSYPRYNFHIKSASKKELAKVVSQSRWKAFLFEGAFPWQFPALIILIASAYYLISYHCEHRKLHKSNC